MLEIFCDGHMITKKRTGSYGAVVTSNQQPIWMLFEIAKEPTTNNREELKAVIAAIEFSNITNVVATIYTDSMYVINGIHGKNKVNLDLWERFFKVYKKHDIKWVKGHSNNKFNSMADVLAKTGILWDYNVCNSLA